MKNLRQFCAGFILVMVFSVAAFAGEIDCPITAPEPLPTTAPGDIDCPVTQLAVSIIASVLSLS